MNDQVQLQSVETWFDPMEMFRQMAPNGVMERRTQVTKDGEDLAARLDDNERSKNVTLRQEIPEDIAAIQEELGDASAVECPFLVRKF